MFGLGTGRCGTHSLMNILNAQNDANITHECKTLPWITNEEYKPVVERIWSRKGVLVGDIAFYWLHYSTHILNVLPNAKFIILKRDREETIESYIKKTKGRNHWMEHDGNYWDKDTIWDRCYPKFNFNDRTIDYDNDKAKAIGEYWDHYYALCDIFIKNHPNNFIQLNTEDLNNGVKVESMLSFIGIENPILKVGVKTNQSG